MGFLARMRVRRQLGASPASPPAADLRTTTATATAAAQPLLARPAPVTHDRPVAELPLAELEFCVIDVETTGLVATEDRIVELALLRMDVRGRVLEELHTLVDPDGEGAGPTDVHGIRDRDLEGAPTFAELAPTIAHLTGGALLVGHNAHFDVGFLRAELARAGSAPAAAPYACTMALRGRLGLPGANAHRLTWACWQEGVGLEQAHAAVCDARATAGLLVRYLLRAERRGVAALTHLSARGVAAESWQAPLPGRPPLAPVPRLRSRPASPRSATVPMPGPPAPEASLQRYRAQLTDAVADFDISQYEALTLAASAADLGLTADQVREAHDGYVHNALEQRLADGVLDWAEQHEVRALAKLLGVGRDELRALLKRAGERATVEGRPGLSLGAAQVEGAITVCFTGTFVAIPMTREEVWQLARDAGMTVAKGVTKDVDVLVCLDPAASSGKLTKAAQHGTVVIDQSTFLALAGAGAPAGDPVSDVLERVQTRKAARQQAATAKAQAATERQRTANRDRAQVRRAAESAEQVLWCSAGEHEWRRPPQRGRPPSVCPDHRPGVTA